MAGAETAAEDPGQLHPGRVRGTLAAAVTSHDVMIPWVPVLTVGTRA